MYACNKDDATAMQVHGETFKFTNCHLRSYFINYLYLILSLHMHVIMEICRIVVHVFAK